MKDMQNAAYQADNPGANICQAYSLDICVPFVAQTFKDKRKGRANLPLAVIIVETRRD